MSPHDLSEQTRRGLDTLAAVSAVTAISLSQIAAIVSIIAGLASIAWVAMRFYDRIRYGPPKGD